MPEGIGYGKNRKSKEEISRAILATRGVPPESPMGKSALRTGILPNVAKKKKRSTLKSIAEKFRRFLPSDILEEAAK